MHHITCILLIIAFCNYAASEDQQNCRVDSFKTQEDFNLTAYMGPWYEVADTAIAPFQHFFDRFVSLFQDVKSYYTLKDDGNVRVLAAGRLFGFCREDEGLGEVQPPGDNPAKLQVSFPDSWVPFPRGPNPYWVMDTDYTGYAFIYSCRGPLDDGTCDPRYTYSWTLNRNKEGHTKEQREIIDKVAKRVCINPEDIKIMPRSRPCPDIKPKTDGDGKKQDEAVKEDSDPTKAKKSDEL